jgi:hypothetical protein
LAAQKRLVNPALCEIRQKSNPVSTSRTKGKKPIATNKTKTKRTKRKGGKTNLNFVAEEFRHYWMERLFLVMPIGLTAIGFWFQGISGLTLFLASWGVLAAFLMPRFRKTRLFIKVSSSEIEISRHLVKDFFGRIYAQDITSVDFTEYTYVGGRAVEIIPLVQIFRKSGPTIEFSLFVNASLESALRSFCRINKIPFSD